MAPKAKGRPPSAKTLVDRQLGRNVQHPVLPAGESFVVPNHSGDHSEGRVDTTPTVDLDLVNKKYVDGEITGKAWLQAINQTGLTGDKTGSFDLTTSGTISLTNVGANIITATNANGDLRLGAGGGTNDFKININGDIDIFENLTLGTNKILSVDHIAEKTSGHKIVVDNDIIIDGINAIRFNSLTGPFLDASSTTFFLDFAGINESRIDFQPSGDDLIIKTLSKPTGGVDLGGSGSTRFRNLNLLGNANIEGNVIVQQLTADVAANNLKLHGAGSGGSDNRGGSTKHLSNFGLDGTDTSMGFTFVNVNSQFVWSKIAQVSNIDTGKAWVDFDDGSCSFAGGNFDVDGSGNITDVSDITMDGNLIFTNSKGLSFGEIYARDNTTTTSTSTTKAQVLIFDTDGQSNNMTAVNAQGHLVVLKPGKYKIDTSISIKNSSGSAHVISVEMYKNNGATVFNNIHAGRNLGTGSDVGNLTMSGIVDVVLNDTLEIWITSDSASARTVTVEDINFSAIQIGGT